MVGGGAAGLAAAIRLAMAGCRVVQLVRAGAAPRSRGESLAPAATAVLRELGAWRGFAADRHLPCHRNVSAWGGAPRQHDFLRDPHGCAWHVDRAALEARLAERAAALGAVCREVREAPRCEPLAQGWHVEAAPGAAWDAAWVVDATGRAGGPARAAGARRLPGQRQLALLAGYGRAGDARAGCEGGDTLVEAVERGWWYSGPSPGGRLWCVLFTDPDLAPRDWRTPRGWQALLAEAPLTCRRLAAGGWRLAEPPAARAAGDARLDRFAGPRWLAAGDAAVAHDPVASHGIGFALASGRDAGAAVAAWLAGDAQAPARYAARLEQAHAAYVDGRRRVYAAEGRWAGSPYWRRRRGAPGAP